MTDVVLRAIDRIQPRTEEDRALLENDALRERLVFHVKNFPAVALPCAENPSAICGVAHVAGVGETWMLTGIGFERDIRVIMRQHRTLLKMAVNVLDLRRLHMLVDPARHGAIRYAEKLGFRAEATLQRMGIKGQDIQMFLFDGYMDSGEYKTSQSLQPGRI